MSRVDRIAGSDRVKVGLSRRGSRFSQLERKLSHRQGVYSPGGLAAYIGRKKYGKKRFQQLSTYGRRHHVGFDERRTHVVTVFERFGFPAIVREKEFSSEDAARRYARRQQEASPMAVRGAGRFGRRYSVSVNSHPEGCNCPFHEGHRKKTPRILHGIGRGPGPR